MAITATAYTITLFLGILIAIILLGAYIAKTNSYHK